MARFNSALGTQRESGMKLQTIPVSAVIAFLLGLLQAYFLLICWAYLNVHSPLPRWLIDTGLRSNALHATLLPIDLFINVILSLPAAFVLVKLRPARISFYLLWAVLPSFVWLNRILIGNTYFWHFFGQFALGWLPALFALPVATWLLSLVTKSSLPNNSFKADGAA